MTQPPPRPNSERTGIRFDGTINLGHILTFAGFVIAGFAAWTNIDKRLTIIEERANFQALIDRQQDARSFENMVQIKESLHEIKAQMLRLGESNRQGGDR